MKDDIMAYLFWPYKRDGFIKEWKGVIEDKWLEQIKTAIGNPDKEVKQ